MHECSIFSSYAYVEFSETESVDTALSMDNSLFRGRLIKVRSLLQASQHCLFTYVYIRLLQSVPTSMDSTVVADEVDIAADTAVDTEGGIPVTAHTVVVGGMLFPAFHLRLCMLMYCNVKGAEVVGFRFCM